MPDERQGDENVTSRSAVRRVARTTARVTLTLAVIGATGLAIQFGAGAIGRNADAAPTPDAAPAIPVSTTRAQLEVGYTVERAFVGQIEPQKTVTVSFELPGRLASVMVDEGDTVAAGDLLATQDLELLEAERARLEASRDAAEAQLRFAEQSVERANALTERGFAPQSGLDQALARQDELRATIEGIDASLRSVDIRIAKSEIRAPFDGRVTERRVDGNETLAAGQPVLGLVATASPQVRIGLPLDIGEADLADARIRIDGQDRTARLIALRPDIDPVTRTRTALFEVDSGTTPAFGQTASLVLKTKVAAGGVWIPVTSLQEGVRGQWSVLTVDAGNIVRTAAVEVLHADGERAFVRGGFTGTERLIDSGPHRVTAGQTVTVTE